VQRPAERSRRRRPTGIALGLLVGVIVGVTGYLVLTVSGGGNAPENKSGSKVAAAGHAAPTSSTTGAPIQYEVRRGDTLTSIAQRFGVSAKRIIDRNKLTNPDTLAEGQTLTIPAAAPTALTIAPSSVTAGGSVALTMTGAKPQEVVKFEVTSPAGTFTGPPHTATDDGKVEGSYDVGFSDPAGTYTVVGRGNLGTVVQGTFRVRASG
jgi:LysM repeat protein